MDDIYLVDPVAKALTAVHPVSLTDIGIREREDLEAWVLDHPEILGEPLLTITSEFSRFDKSNRRLDVLMLDKNGTLVVVELKLDLDKTFADQQAIRYAAFCSTMTMEDIVQGLAEFQSCSREEAARTICEFLEAEDLPELDQQPRIILAAGSLDDQELTATVLWLREFGVDMTCVELTPYKIAGENRLILVPRTIIPLPEAREYVIRVEQREAKKHQSKASGRHAALWRAVADEFNALGTGFHATGRARGNYMQVRVGHSRVHYEWMWRKMDAQLDACLHLEWPERDQNLRHAERIKAQEERIREGVNLEFDVGKFGRKWAEARFRIPYDGTIPDSEIAPLAASVMKTLIERTHALVQQIIEEDRTAGAQSAATRR